MFYVVFLERAFAGLESTDREERLRGVAREPREVEGRPSVSGASSVVRRNYVDTCNGFFIV